MRDFPRGGPDEHGGGERPQPGDGGTEGPIERAIRRAREAVPPAGPFGTASDRSYPSFVDEVEKDTFAIEIATQGEYQRMPLTETIAESLSRRFPHADREHIATVSRYVEREIGAPSDTASPDVGRAENLARYIKQSLDEGFAYGDPADDEGFAYGDPADDDAFSDPEPLGQEEVEPDTPPTGRQTRRGFEDYGE